MRGKRNPSAPINPRQPLIKAETRTRREATRSIARQRGASRRIGEQRNDREVESSGFECSLPEALGGFDKTDNKGSDA